MIEKLLTESLAAAMEKLREHSELVVSRNDDGTIWDAPNLGESMLRSLLLAEVMRRQPNAWCQTEWTRERYDLLLTIGEGHDLHAVIEFKLFEYCRGYTLDGDPEKGWKGYPSAKNKQELRDCVEKLKKLKRPEIRRKLVVLVYQTGKPSEWNGKHTYDNLYGKLDDIDVQNVELIPHSWQGHLVCKLLEVA